jgi:hypothetical protein
MIAEKKKLAQAEKGILNRADSVPRQYGESPEISSVRIKK